MKVYIMHIQSESGENYYSAFSNKPTAAQEEAEQLRIFKNEGYGSNSDYWTDLVPVRAIEEVELK